MAVRAPLRAPAVATEGSLGHSGSGRRRLLAALLASILVVLVIVPDAWLCDDAFITFRVVDNFHHGLGLRWNPDERVQVATHPLWLLTLSAVSTYTGELPLTAIFLSLILTAAALALVLAGVSRSWVGLGVGLVALGGSRAFVEYSTSGLENPLAHLLLAALLFVWVRSEVDGLPPRPVLVGLLAGCALVTRIDLVIVVAPLVVAMLLRRRSLEGALRIAVGGLPLLAWAVFAVLYYGFFLPNTAWAKSLSTGIPRGELLAHGARYLGDSLGGDPLTLVAVAAAAVVAAARGRRLLPIAAGMLGYVAYVVWIGGDFMSGRFLTVPLLCAAAILVRGVPALSRPGRVVLVTGLAGLAIWSTLLRVDVLPRRLRAPGVSDEVEYYADLRLMRLLSSHGESLREYPMARGGLEAGSREYASVEVDRAVGMRGYFAGPRVHIIDVLGLGDPLLARLPAAAPWRAGHYPRLLPEGYVETVATGRNQIRDRDLAAYYDALRSVVRDPVWDRSRLVTVLRFHLGAYDRLLNAYVEQRLAHDAGHG